MKKPISRSLVLGPLLVSSLLVSSILAHEIPKGGQAGPLECTLSGDVSGPGHKIRIPDGYLGCAGWHRVFIVPIVDLSQDRYIYVSYTTTPYPSESTNLHAQRLEIGGMPGERVVTRHYTDGVCVCVEDLVMLTSTLPNPHLTDTPYFDLDLVLFSTPEHYENDRKVFESMLSSIRQDPNAE